MLQVYQDNLPALRLYTDLGFQQVAGEMGLPWRRSKRGPSMRRVMTCAPANRPCGGQAAYNLAGLALPTMHSG